MRDDELVAKLGGAQFEDEKPGPRPWQGDAQSMAVTDMKAMFERDQQRKREQAEARQRALEALPDAPAELNGLMMREPWLAEWLTRLAAKLTN